MSDTTAPSDATLVQEAKETADFDRQEPPKEKRERPRDRVKEAIADLKKRTAEVRAEKESDDEPAPAPKEKPKAAPKAEPKPEPKADSKAAEKADKAVEKIEKMGGAAPDQRKGESDENYALRVVKLQRELEAERKAAKEAREESAKDKAETAKLKKIIEDGKANPLKVLKHLGLKYEDLARGIVEGKYTEPEKEFELPPEVAERIARLEKADKDREAAAEKARAETKRKDDVSAVQKFIDDNADDFPLASGLTWAAANVVAEAYASGETDVTKMLKDLEGNLEKNLESLVKSERGRKKLTKLDPTLKEWLQKELGVELPKAKPSDEEAPESLSDLRADPPARRKRTKADRMAEALEELRSKRRKAGGDEDDED